MAEAIGHRGLRLIHFRQPGPVHNNKDTHMASTPSYSRAELDDRIAILRDNIRQLTEQAAGSSGAADEERTANRIAEQQDELDALIKQRDALPQR